MNEGERPATVWKWKAGIAILALLTAFAGYLYFFETWVVFKNDLPSAITDVRIGMAGKTLWLGGLAPHESKIIFANPRGDELPGHTSVEISFRADGRHVNERFGYVARNAGQQMFLTARPYALAGIFPSLAFDVVDRVPMGKGYAYRYDLWSKK